MIQHLLRIEAVNLDSVLEDTQQLSVIRGGGLLALDAVREFDGEDIHADRGRSPRWLAILTRWLRRSRKAQLISRGASVGLYRIELPADPSPEPHARLVDSVARRLARRYPHHSFVVDIEPERSGADGFATARNRVIAKNRLRQMRQPSLSLADCNAGDDGPCELDDLRPAKLRRTPSDPTSPMYSVSVHARYQAGKRKRDFLNALTGLDFDYTQDFETLAGNFPADRRLQNKLAVVYFDGNNFGRFQEQCRSPEALEAFDLALQAARVSLLRSLLLDLSELDSARCWTGTAELPEPEKPGSPVCLRFELLLWGGDEILFVVPAWLGFTALFKFYACMADCRWYGPVPAGAEGRTEGQPLTHAGALIFCDHKTPIDRMTRLARDLADRVKEQAIPGSVRNAETLPGRSCNRFDYLILESIDFPAEPLDRYFARRYRSLGHSRTALEPVSGGLGFLKAIARQRDTDELPHGRLHEGAYGLIGGEDACDAGDTAAELLEQELLRRAQATGNDAVTAFTQLRANLLALLPHQSTAWRWVHLAELWDYLAPRSPSASPSRRPNPPDEPAQANGGPE